MKQAMPFTGENTAQLPPNFAMDGFFFPQANRKNTMLSEAQLMFVYMSYYDMKYFLDREDLFLACCGLVP